MRARNLLQQGGVLLIALLSTMVNAEGDNKKINSVIPSADVQEGEVVHVIKLEDILEGKYAKEKKTVEGETADKVKVDKSSENQPARDMKSSVAAKPAVSNPIDMKEAFAAVMGYDSEPVTQPQPQVANPAPALAPSNNGSSTGWLYLGKFSQGQWDQKNNQVLGLKGALPQAGKDYTVGVFSNVRQGYPSKKGMPPIVKVLPQGSKIKLLGVHNSGKSGHYWANVQWF